jgi:hypothetical protein
MLIRSPLATNQLDVQPSKQLREGTSNRMNWWSLSIVVRGSSNHNEEVASTPVR